MLKQFRSALETQRQSGSTTWIAEACKAQAGLVWVVVADRQSKLQLRSLGVPESNIRTVPQILKEGFPEKRPVVLDPACLWALG